MVILTFPPLHFLRYYFVYKLLYPCFRRRISRVCVTVTYHDYYSFTFTFPPLSSDHPPRISFIATHDIHSSRRRELNKIIIHRVVLILYVAFLVIVSLPIRRNQSGSSGFPEMAA